MSCTGTRIMAYAGSGVKSASPAKKTYAHRVVANERPSGASSFGSPKVTMRFSGRKN